MEQSTFPADFPTPAPPFPSDASAATGYVRLLEQRLNAFGLHTWWLDSGDLQVVDLTRADAGPGAPTMHNTISCEAREDDDGRLWFFGLPKQPIARALCVDDAARIIHGKLTGELPPGRAALAAAAPIPK